MRSLPFPSPAEDTLAFPGPRAVTRLASSAPPLLWTSTLGGRSCVPALVSPPGLAALPPGAMACPRTEVQELPGDGLSDARAPASDDGRLVLQQASRQAALALGPRPHHHGPTERPARTRSAAFVTREGRSWGSAHVTSPAHSPWSRPAAPATRLFPGQAPPRPSAPHLPRAGPRSPAATFRPSASYRLRRSPGCAGETPHSLCKNFDAIWEGGGEGKMQKKYIHILSSRGVLYFENSILRATALTIY